MKKRFKFCLMISVLALSLCFTGSAALAENTEEKERIVEEDFVFEGDGIIEIQTIPEEYLEETEHSGTVERFDYNNGEEEKHFNVYLPYGYSDGDNTYDVLYFIHGGAGTPEIYLRQDRKTWFHTTLDHMIENGDIEPIIVVSPEWNSSLPDKGDSSELIELFAQDELKNTVVPLVDENYRTNPGREHRAFGGFSMGGMTTWYVLTYCMDTFQYYIPCSGEYQPLGHGSDIEKGREITKELEQKVIEQGYGPEDFLIYFITGTQDIAIPNIAPQVYAMQESDFFRFGDNIFFGALQDAPHMDKYTTNYIYTALPNIFNTGDNNQ